MKIKCYVEDKLKLVKFLNDDTVDILMVFTNKINDNYLELEIDTNEYDISDSVFTGNKNLFYIHKK